MERSALFPDRSYLRTAYFLDFWFIQLLLFSVYWTYFLNVTYYRILCIHMPDTKSYLWHLLCLYYRHLSFLGCSSSDREASSGERHSSNMMSIKSPPSSKIPHIKKPLNAFMLFMKEMRQKVIDECTLKESAAINQILGRKVRVLVFQGFRFCYDQFSCDEPVEQMNAGEF